MCEVERIHSALVGLSELLGRRVAGEPHFVGADIGIADATSKTPLHKWRGGADYRKPGWVAAANAIRTEYNLPPINSLKGALFKHFCATNHPGILEGFARLGARRRDPNSAIVATGHSDLVVLDLDVRATKDGNHSLHKLLSELDLELPATLTATTPSGGRHLYFRYPGLPSKIGLRPGLDIKASGGYVLAPLLGDDDRRWIDTAYPIADLPNKLAMRISKTSRGNRTSFIGTKKRATPRIPKDRFADVLQPYNPLDYRDQEKWFRFMCAFHRTTGGHGLQEFLDWSMSDPLYNTPENKRSVTSRWNSLKLGDDHDFED